jgi:hypothetical protein
MIDFHDSLRGQPFKRSIHIISLAWAVVVVCLEVMDVLASYRGSP